jgi:quinol monooxygenase YgiN
MRKRTYTPADFNIGFAVATAIEATPSGEDAVGAILQGLVAPTTAEPGVKLFLPYRSPDNPARFFIHELYVDDSGWRRHHETTHVKTAIAELLPRTAARERAVHPIF